LYKGGSNMSERLGQRFEKLADENVTFVAIQPKARLVVYFTDAVYLPTGQGSSRTNLREVTWTK